MALDCALGLKSCEAIYWLKHSEGLHIAHYPDENTRPD